MARAAPRPPSELPVMRTVRLGVDMIAEVVEYQFLERKWIRKVARWV